MHFVSSLILVTGAGNTFEANKLRNDSRQAWTAAPRSRFNSYQLCYERTRASSSICLYVYSNPLFYAI